MFIGDFVRVINDGGDDGVVVMVMVCDIIFCGDEFCNRMNYFLK
jgi:hypothetical protein